MNRLRAGALLLIIYLANVDINTDEWSHSNISYWQSH